MDSRRPIQNPEHSPDLPKRHIYSVSQLNSEIRTLLEGSFPAVWLEAELSNVATPGSGHWYFTLKDEAAQVRCAMFRNRNMLLRFRPENGMQVLVRAKVGLYEPRGDYQLIVEHMEEAGDGALRRAFEELKNKLNKEGLFESSRKKSIPPLPKAIGVITSPTGAAVRDILSTLKRRFPAIPVIIYPVMVQGETAANSITQAMQLANKRQECDVLIVARGGGSLEDLWSFNEETVARSIAASVIPVISGVGHEVDFTIADFVADLRAPTPTAAAEAATPDRMESRRRVQQWEKRLANAMQGYLRQQEQHVRWVKQRIVHPGNRLQQITQRLDELTIRRSNLIQSHLKHLRQNVSISFQTLQQHNPGFKLQVTREKLTTAYKQLQSVMRYKLETQHKSLHNIAHNLETVSPLATLGRGYAIVQDPSSDNIITKTNQVRPGQLVKTRLHSGHLLCTVNEVNDE